MTTETTQLEEMQDRIDRIEKNALELKHLGAEIPVIEKNMQIVLSVVHNLKFGIVDPALMLDR